MSYSTSKIHPLGTVTVEDPSSPLTNATDAPLEPISTSFTFPKWQPPELQVCPSDRQSFGSRGSVDDEPPPDDAAASRLTSDCRRWLASCLPWASPSSEAETEKQTAEPALGSSGFVVHPHSAFYIHWYITIVTVALLVAIFDPYNAAFVKTAGMYPFYNFWAVTDYVATAFLTADIVLKFFLAYKDENNKCIIVDNRAVAWQYFTSQFWFDLVVSIPVEPIVAGCLGYTVRDTPEAKFVGLLRWLRVGRMYPIFGVFATIQHKQILHPVVLLLARNYTYLFYIVHWMACVIYFIAQVGDFGENTWIGRDEAQDRLRPLDGWADYLYSFYFSIGVFTGFSHEVFYKNNPVEAIALCLYFAVNVVAQAYILGTITVLLVGKDVESGEYRNAVINLDKYLSDKELPKSLQAAMHEHLELQSYSEKTADDNILKHHPSTIKQKVLWHLYQDVLKDCYLLAGCTPQFLTLLLSVARMELFMPNVTITQQGDTAGDLLIIADGNLSVAPPSSAATDPHGKNPSMGGPSMGGFNASEHGSMSVDVSTALPRMDSVSANTTSIKQRDSAMSYSGALANTTSIKQLDSAMIDSSNKMARFGGGDVMTGGSANGADPSIIIGDGDTQGKGEDSVMKNNEGILWNLLKSVDISKRQEGSAHGRDSSLHGGSSFGSVSSRQQSFMHGPSGQATVLGTSDTLGEVPFLAESVYTSAARTCSVTRVLIISYADFQRLAESNPKDVSRIIKNMVKGAEKRLKEVAKQAMDAGQLEPASGQTLIHIAEGEPLEAVPSIQLAGIKRSLTPAQLITLEHVSEARRLFREDAIKHQNFRMNACLNAAVCGNTQRLQAYMGRGRDVSATDYDNRSALMLACRNNHEDAVEMLLKAGADTSTVDSMGYTALFEAVREGNDGCISLMLKYNARLGVEPRISGPFIFQAIISKDLKCLRRLIRVGADLDCTNLNGRTPLFLAASEGLLEVVILLVEEANVTVDAVDSWGHTPEGDARLAGHHEVAQYLQIQGNKKQLLPASEGSLNAQQAEEPSPQATEESPPRRSSERGHAARSSHSYSQLTFGIGSRQFLRSSSRPSIDQKRQELRRSMRNRTVSVNGTGRSRLAPSSSGTRRRPTTPTAFEEQPPSTFPANSAGSASLRPMTPTAFEEQPPHISSEGFAGPTINPSFRLRPVSKLVEDTSFEKPDVLRPPGTSPAGWVTSDGANRPGSGPGTDHAHPLPKVGSFPAETTGDNEAGESMVLPFVDPESGAAHKSGAAHCNPCYV